MQIEETENLDDLYKVKKWVHSKAECRTWAGEIVRFPFVDTSLEDDIEFTQHQHFVVRINAELAAFAQMTDVSPQHSHIGRLIINPAFRGQGIAPKFFKLLTDQAQRQKPNISLFTH